MTPQLTLSSIQVKALWLAPPLFAHVPKQRLFAMPRGLIIATAILTISHSYVSALLMPATCLSGYDWVRRQLEKTCIKFVIWLL